MFSPARFMLRFASILGVILVLLVGSASPTLAGVNWIGVPVNPNTPMAFEDPNNWDALDFDPNSDDPITTASGPELEPPGMDSTWFIEDVNDPNDVPLENNVTILMSVPRDGSNSTTNAKIGAFAIGGGNKSQIQTLLIQTDMTITGLERLTDRYIDDPGSSDPNDVLPDPDYQELNEGRRELRAGRQDTTSYYSEAQVPGIGQGTVNSSVPGYDQFPWGVVRHSTGKVLLEYELGDDPNTVPSEGSKADIKLSADKDYSAGSLWEISGDAELELLSDVQVANKRIVSPGAVFRVVGSDVQQIDVGNRFSVTSETAAWDLTDFQDFGSVQTAKLNRGKGIVEFVLDAGGVTPINVGNNLNIGGAAAGGVLSLDSVILPGFLRIKLKEPTTAGTGEDRVALFISDRISSSIAQTLLGSTSQTYLGIFYDPDRPGEPGQQHDPIQRNLGTDPNDPIYDTVQADYAGVVYTWDIIYEDDRIDDGNMGGVFLTNLQISGGIAGDFDDMNGLDAADIDALCAAIGSISLLESLEATQGYVGNYDENNPVSVLSQPMFDLDGDGLITMDDYTMWVTHAGFADTNFGDVDLDGDIDGDDLSVIELNYGMNSGAGWGDGDTDKDGDVDGDDFLTWQRNYTGPGPLQAAAAVPEPSAALLLSLGSCVLLTRRRR